MGAFPKFLIPPVPSDPYTFQQYEALLTIWVSPTRCWSSGAVPCRNIGWTPWKRLTPHGMRAQLRGLQDDHLRQNIEIFASEGTRKTRITHFMQKWYVIILKKIHVLWFRKLFPIFQEMFSILSPFQNRLHHLSKMFTPVKQQSGIHSNYTPQHKKKLVMFTHKTTSLTKGASVFFYRTFFPPTDQLVFFVDRLHLHVIDLTHEFHHLRFFGPGTAPGPLHWKAENLWLSMMIHRLSTFSLPSGDRNVFLLLRWLLGEIKHVVILNCVRFFVMFVLEGKMCQHKSVGGCCTRDSKRHLRHEEKQLITFHLIMGGS